MTSLSTRESSAVKAGEKSPLDASEAFTKRQLGAYYTPPEVSQILANWAIRHTNDLILEPGFGGCGFLSAAMHRLRELNNPYPERNLFGCDIDPAAFEYLSTTIGPVAVNGGRFKCIDFLKLSPSDYPVQQFQSALGNPPYVSISNMLEEQKKAACKLANEAGLILSKRASLWAYFVIHALSFLANNGRVAWVLPGSFLYTDYGKQVQQIMLSGFSRAIAIEIKEKIFRHEGANESAVIVLADGWRTKDKADSFRIMQINSVSGLQVAIQGWEARAEEGDALGHSPVLSMLPADLRAAYSTLLQQPFVHTFSSIADVKIGIVTGNSDFFVMTKNQARERQLPDSALRKILLRGSYIDSIELDDATFESMDSVGKRCWLFNPRGEAEFDVNVRKYMDSYSAEERATVSTFDKRGAWHLPDDENIPDAFLTYMSDMGPRLVINTTEINATNSIHRVYWHSKCPRYLKRLLSISMLSTFAQLGAEIVGRRYGSGMLKMEPSSYAKLPVLWSTNFGIKATNKTFADIKASISVGDYNQATRLADLFMYSNLDIPRRQQTSLSEALDCARASREQDG